MTKTFGRGTAQPGITGRGGGRSTSRRTHSPKKRVKQEKLEENGHLVTPVKKRSFHDIMEDDETYNISDILDIIKGTSDIKIEDLKLADLKEVVYTWKLHNFEDTKTINKSTKTQLLNCIEDMKSTIATKSQRDLPFSPPQSLVQEIEEETQHIFDTVKNMKVDRDTTNEQILQFTHRQRAHFTYWTTLSKEEIIPLEDLLSAPEEDIIRRIQTWRDEQATIDTDTVMLSSSDEEDIGDIYESPAEAMDIDKNENVLLSKENSKENVPVSKQSPTVSIQLDRTLTNDQMNSLNLSQLKDMYNQFLSKNGSSIAREVLDLWPVSLLKRNIKLRRDQLINEYDSEQSSNRNENQKKSTKPSSLKKTVKYVSNPVQVKLEKQAMQKFRYNMNFLLPTEYKGIEGVRSYFSEIFHEMAAFCQEELKLLPWDKSSDKIKTITDCDDLPISITQLKLFLHDLRAPVPGVRSYFKFQIGLPIRQRKDTFDADTFAFCQSQNIRINECAVQHPNVRTIGWLVYVPNSIDNKKWSRAVTEMHQLYRKDKNAPDLNIGLVWKPLNGQYGIDSKKKVYAMHIEAPRPLMSNAKKFIRLLAQNKRWPLGVRFRLMDEYNQYMSDNNQVKYRYLRDKHKTFLKQMKQYVSEDFICIDKKIGDSKLTIRDVFNNIRDDDDGRRIFSSIDSKWNDSDTHIAVFRPDKASKAVNFVKYAVAYIKHLFPKAPLHRIFKIDALESTDKAVYDPETQTFITQDQIDMDKIFQDDLDDASFEYLDISEEQENNDENIVDIRELKLIGGEKLFNLTGDDDTASTHPATSSMISFSNASVHLYDTESCADGSTASEIEKNPSPTLPQTSTATKQNDQSMASPPAEEAQSEAASA